MGCICDSCSSLLCLASFTTLLPLICTVLSSEQGCCLSCTLTAVSSGLVLLLLSPCLHQHIPAGKAGRVLSVELTKQLMNNAGKV